MRDTYPMAETGFDRLDGDLGLHGIGDEAELVRLVVQLVELRLVRHRALEDDAAAAASRFVIAILPGAIRSIVPTASSS